DRPGAGALAAQPERVPGTAEPACAGGAGPRGGADEQPGVFVQSLIPHSFRVRMAPCERKTKPDWAAMSPYHRVIVLVVFLTSSAWYIQAQSPTVVEGTVVDAKAAVAKASVGWQGHIERVTTD